MIEQRRGHFAPRDRRIALMPMAKKGWQNLGQFEKSFPLDLVCIAACLIIAGIGAYAIGGL